MVTSEKSDTDTDRCLFCNGNIGVLENGVCYRCNLINHKVDALIPDYFKGMNFDNFKCETDQHKSMLKTAKEFIVNDCGLVICGSVGIGKTHLAISVLRELLFADNNVKLVSVPELFLQIRESFKNRTETENDIVDRYSSFDWLILDDFGAEKSSDYTIEIMYVLIDKRYKNNKHKMFVTSNLSLQKLAEQTSDRIVSRLVEMCRIMEIDLPDYRLNKRR